MSNSNCYASINKWGLLAIEGPDVERFLQGQLTCDMRELAARSSLPGALCNNKGRVLCTFYIVPTEQGVLLRLPVDLLETIQAYLQTYAAFFKVQMQIRDDLQGLTMLGKIPAFPSNYCLIQHSDHFSELWLTAEQFQEFDEALNDWGASGSESTWLFQLIESGEAQIFAETSGAFMAHQLSLDLCGAISFRKGCYTGQEIIARTQYRGKSKTRLGQLVLSSQEVFTPGTELTVTSANGQSRVVVLCCAEAGQETRCQVVLPMDLPIKGTIEHDGVTASYRRLALPYDEKETA